MTTIYLCSHCMAEDIRQEATHRLLISSKLLHLCNPHYVQFDPPEGATIDRHDLIGAEAASAAAVTESPVKREPRKKVERNPVVFVSPTGDFVVCLSNLGDDPHETFSFRGFTFCRPTLERFLPPAGWTQETLSEFFGVSLPHFIGADDDPEDFVEDFVQRESRLAGHVPGEAIGSLEERETERLERMHGHLLLQNHPRRKDRKLAPKTLHSIRLTTETQRVSFLKAELERLRVPPVRVWAALTGQSESAAGPERDRLCERILRENPAMSRVSWTRHSSRRSIASELAPSPEDLKKLLTMPMAPVKPLLRR